MKLVVAGGGGFRVPLVYDALLGRAGVVTEAVRAVLGDRAVGVCGAPRGLCRRVARALGRDRVWFDYYGLNHLGWLGAVRDRGRDMLPGLLADDAALESFEEGRL